MGRVPYLADQHFQYVLHGHQAEDPARRVGDLGQMRRRAAHHGQGVVEGQLGPHGRHGAPHVLRDGPLTVLQVEDVLDVQVAHEGAAALRADGEARVARPHRELLDPARGDGRVHRHQGRPVQEHVGDGPAAQLQGVLQPLLRLRLQEPGLSGVLDEPVELLAGEDGLHLVLGLDAEEPEHQPGAGAQRRGDGPAEPGETDEAGAQPQRGLLRGRHRQVLRDHLADDEVEEDDEDQRQHEAERMDQSFGQVRRVEDRLQQMGDGRLRDGAQRQ